MLAFSYMFRSAVLYCVPNVRFVYGAVIRDLSPEDRELADGCRAEQKYELQLTRHCG